MRFNFSILLLVFFVTCGKKEKQFEYPFIENVQKVETHFNLSYVNDYVNLENFRDSSIVDWFKKQDTISEHYFKSSEGYETYLQRIEKFAKVNSSGTSKIKYDERFSTYFLQEEDTSQSLFKRNNQTGKQERLLDQSLYKDGSWSIDYYEPSYNGNHIAIALGKNDDFFKTIIILDTQTKRIMAEIDAQTKPNMVGGIVWSPDNLSILFIAYPNTAELEKTNDSFLALYDLKQNNYKPKSIFKNGDFGINFSPEYYVVPKFRSGKDEYIFVYIANANDYWDCYYTTYEAFRQGNYDWKKLFDEKDFVLYDYGTERNHQFYYKRIKDGNMQLCQLDLRHPNGQPTVLFEGDAEEQLSSFKVVGNAIFYTVAKNGIEERLFKIDASGTSKEINLPKVPGEINMTYRSPYQNDLWIQLNGWTINYERYKILENDSIIPESFPPKKSFPEFANIVSQVVEVESHDGIRVPVSIVHRSDFKKSGNNKAIITVYGAYGLSESPWFHEPILDFVNQGNIYVTAHVRGGGEKGPEWHAEGMMLNKPNSWKDLNHTAKFLITDGWVHADKIGLNANSAGAVTVGMAVNTEPKLYNAMTLFNGSVNVIRTESIEGYDTTDNSFEFGSATDSLSFASIRQMDPVINFNAGIDYPSTLLLMGYKDYLVPPSANGKYIALMQRSNKTTPYLLDVDFEGEHEIDWYTDYAKAIFFINKELDR